MSEELNKKEQAAKAMLEARDSINDPATDNAKVESVSAEMLDSVESNGLGKVSMDNFGQGRPDKSADQFLG